MNDQADGLRDPLSPLSKASMEVTFTDVSPLTINVLLGRPAFRGTILPIPGPDESIPADEPEFAP